MNKLAAETLPEGFATEWTSLAYQQIKAGNTAIFAFVLAVVFVFLVLRRNTRASLCRSR